MDSTLSTLGFVILGFSISFYAIVVQSRIEDGRGAESSSAPMVLPPPSPPMPPPPSPLEDPPPPGSPPPPGAPQPRNAPPNQLVNNKPNKTRSSPRHYPRHPRKFRPPPPPPPPLPHGMNSGKKVGLLFVGIAAIMQIGVVGFLVFKRRQLLRTNDRYETCS